MHRVHWNITFAVSEKGNLREIHKKLSITVPLGLASCWTPKDSSEGHEASQTLCMSSISSSLHDRTGLGSPNCTGGSSWTAGKQ